MRLRFLLLTLSILGAIYAGFVAFEPGRAIELVRYTGYWVLLAAFAWFTYEAARQAWRKVDRRALTSRPFLVGLGIVLLTGGFIHVNEEKEFKILMDETSLLGTAHQMHETRQVYLATRVHDIRGVTSYLDGFVDKRPFLYPFLVSLAHDFTGYRVANAFGVNVLLSFVLLGLTLAFGKELAGWKGGYLAVILWAAVPELSRSASGTGFEVLNLVLITLVMWLSCRYLRRPDRDNLTLLLLASVLMLYGRYEAAIFLLPVGLVILLGWVKERTPRIPLAMFAAPLLVIPLAWQNKLFGAHEHFWEMPKSVEGPPFSLAYVPDNLTQAVRHFLNFNSFVPNNPWIVIGGMIALLFFLLYLRKCFTGAKDPKEADPPRLRPAETVLALFLISFAIGFAMLMTFYHGQLERPMVQRLALPYYLPWIFAIVAVVFGRYATTYVRRGVWGAVAVMFAVYVFPVKASQEYTQVYRPSDQMARLNQFREEMKGQRYLVIGQDPGFFVPYGNEFVLMKFAQNRKKQVKTFLQNPANPPIYVYQMIAHNPAVNRFKAYIPTWLDEDFEREIVWRVMFGEHFGMEMSRLVDVHNVEPEVFPEDGTMDEFWHWYAKNLP